jgi:hypothetical protein
MTWPISGILQKLPSGRLRNRLSFKLILEAVIPGYHGRMPRSALLLEMPAREEHVCDIDMIRAQTLMFPVDPTASSTFSDIEPGGFEITYVDGQKSSGDYFQDAMTIGDASLKGLEMAVATTTTRGYGILGIGYESNEANIQTGNGTQYVNLVEALVDSGAIASYAFSLWLDDLRKLLPTLSHKDIPF